MVFYFTATGNSLYALEYGPAVGLAYRLRQQ